MLVTYSEAENFLVNVLSTSALNPHFSYAGGAVPVRPAQSLLAVFAPQNPSILLWSEENQGVNFVYPKLQSEVQKPLRKPRFCAAFLR